MNYEDIPYGYAHCYATAEQCPQCNHCLRHHAAVMNEALATPNERVNCVTTAYIHKVASGHSCAHFRSDEPLRYARGMKGIFDMVPKKLYPQVRNQVINCFSSERVFYYAQNGQQLISPSQQQRIAHVFEAIGLAAPTYTQYVMRPNWDS